MHHTHSIFANGQVNSMLLYNKQCLIQSYLHFASKFSKKFLIHMVNYTKFPPIMALLSGQQPGNKNTQLLGYWPFDWYQSHQPWMTLNCCKLTTLVPIESAYASSY